jgi:hypothetical protein
LNHKATDKDKAIHLRPFVDLLETFFQGRPPRSVKDSSESVLQAIIESLCFDSEHCIPEVCLVVDPTKAYRSGRLGFVDLLFIPETDSFGSPVPVVELKNATLSGIWRATQASPSDGELIILRDALKSESEEELLQRQYCYWNKESSRWHQQSIRDLKNKAMQQIQAYLLVLGQGMTNSATAGILDRRLCCE